MSHDPDRARALLERARELSSRSEYLELAERLEALPREQLLDEPELGFLLARTWKLLGRPEEALELVRATRPVCDHRGDGRLTRLCVNLEATLLFDVGRMAAARETWLAVLDMATRAGDAEMIAFVNNNLGVLSTLHSQSEEALASYGRAVAAYQRLGSLRRLAQSHHNLGITYRELGFLSQADEHFLRAAEYAREDGSEDELARVDQERALLLFYEGDVPLSMATAKRALERYEKLGDPAGSGEAWRVLGIVHLGQRSLLEARRHLDRALILARDARAALLEAETVEVLAALEELEGDEAAAAQLRSHADAVFARLRATAWGIKSRRQAQAIAAGESPVPSPPGRL